MGRNAQQRRAAKRTRHGARRHIDLIDYVSTRWHIPRRRARELLLSGKVNVNGKVYAYLHVPRDVVERDDLGRLRIMVEGFADTRAAGAPLLRQRRPQGRTK